LEVSLFFSPYHLLFVKSKSHFPQKTPLCPLAFDPIILLDSVFFFPYTLPIKSNFKLDIFAGFDKP